MHELICARCERREACPGTRNQTCLRTAEELVAELSAKLGKAIEAIREPHMEGRCWYCRHHDAPNACAEVNFNCAECPHPCKCGYCDGGSNWEWKE